MQLFQGEQIVWFQDCHYKYQVLIWIQQSLVKLEELYLIFQSSAVAVSLISNWVVVFPSGYKRNMLWAMTTRLVRNQGIWHIPIWMKPHEDLATRIETKMSEIDRLEQLGGEDAGEIFAKRSDMVSLSKCFGLLRIVHLNDIIWY